MPIIQRFLNEKTAKNGSSIIPMRYCFAFRQFNVQSLFLANNFAQKLLTILVKMKLFHTFIAQCTCYEKHKIHSNHLANCLVWLLHLSHFCSEKKEG
jgi:hypothetical protein